jgi:hypothetical protein
MLKRVKYISRFSRALSPAEIEELGRQAAQKNESLGITGVLLTGGGFFFQILEGPKEAVDTVYNSIAGDVRHQQVLLVASQEGVRDRIFPDWAMKRVNLDHEANAHMETLRALLPIAFEQRRHVDELIGTLERAMWQELMTRAD